MYGIVATLYNFRNRLQTGVKIKCRTEHKSLEFWVKKDLDRMGGPMGRRSRWNQFLARFFRRLSTSRGKTAGQQMCSLSRHIRLIRPTLIPTCMGAMPTKQVGTHQSRKLRSGLTESSQN